MSWKFYGICLYLALKIATHMASQLCIGFYAKNNIYAASYEAYKRATMKTKVLTYVGQVIHCAERYYLEHVCT